MSAERWLHVSCNPGPSRLTPAWLKESGRGMAAVEALTEYRRELHAGDLVSVHSELVEVRAKALRFRHRMRLGGQGGEIVAVSMLTAVHLDATASKAIAFPSALVEGWRMAGFTPAPVPAHPTA